MLDQNHLTQETIDRLIREALLPEELEPVEDHLEACLMCRSRVRSAFRGIEAGEPLSLSGPPPGWRPRDFRDPEPEPVATRPRLALVLAIGLGALLGVLFAVVMTSKS